MWTWCHQLSVWSLCLNLRCFGSIARSFSGKWGSWNKCKSERTCRNQSILKNFGPVSVGKQTTAVATELRDLCSLTHRPLPECPRSCPWLWQSFGSTCRPNTESKLLEVGPRRRCAFGLSSWRENRSCCHLQRKSVLSRPWKWPSTNMQLAKEICRSSWPRAWEWMWTTRAPSNSSRWRLSSMPTWSPRAMPRTMWDSGNLPTWRIRRCWHKNRVTQSGCWNRQPQEKLLPSWSDWRSGSKSNSWRPRKCHCNAQEDNQGIPVSSISQLLDTPGDSGGEHGQESGIGDSGIEGTQRVYPGSSQKGPSWDSRGVVKTAPAEHEICGLGEMGVSRTLDPVKAQLLSAMADRVVPDHFQSLVSYERPILFEVACSPDSVLTEHMQKKMQSSTAAQRFAHWNGYDLTKGHGVRSVIKKIDDEKPLHVWISTECGPYSRMQNLNQRNPEQREALRQKREECLKQYVGGLAIYTHCCQTGVPCTWEWSETCDAWRLPMVQKVFQRWNPYMVVVKGCRVNLRDLKSKRFLGKGWKLATTHELLATRMHLPCTCENPRDHELCQGRLTRESAFYTDDFARRVCRAIVDGVSWKQLSLEVMGERSKPKEFVESPSQCTCHEVRHPRSELSCNVCEMEKHKSDPMCLAGEEVEEVPFSLEEKRKLMARIAAIHRNTGHGPVEHPSAGSSEDWQTDCRLG